MSRSFLTPEKKEEFAKLLKRPFSLGLEAQEQIRKNSLFLEECLEQRLDALGDWKTLLPVALGSWARHELCPCSDLDIVFLGNEDRVFSFVSRVQENGLRLRYRVPQDQKDWTLGVEPFDVLALLGARALTPEAQQLLENQIEKLNQKKLRPAVLKAILIERQKRQDRLNSITNFLEPQLKFSPGGLRDIEQALAVHDLYKDRMQRTDHALTILKQYKSFLLGVRQRLQIVTGQDTLVGPEQPEMARGFGFENLGPFMKELQKGLSRSFFYSEWILSCAQTSRAQVEKIESWRLHKPTDLVGALKKDQGILSQKRVRESMDKVFPKSLKPPLKPMQVKGLQEMMRGTDEFLVAVFGSRLMDKLLPPTKDLVGYVQHDQYHRFTADIHIQQACREFRKVWKRPAELGLLRYLHKDLSVNDWKILFWTCLFHDIDKGQGGDHSHKGAESVQRWLPARGFSSAFKTELSWMVKNHLLFSELAFRKNSSSWITLKELEELGADPVRLKRLAVFTAIDIRATNPEAWNRWKSQLMADFLKDLSSPASIAKQKFLKRAQKALPKLSVEAFSSLDPFLLQRVPDSTLVNDLKSLTGDSSHRVLKVGGRLWVRFFSAKDRLGLLAEFVDRLFQSGTKIQHASVQSVQGLGVYDWFQVDRPGISVRELHLALDRVKTLETLRPNVVFDQIDIEKSGDSEWIVGFKAKDQRGLLKAACSVLSEAGADIKSARVHTWGLKVEDVFLVSYPGPELELREKISAAHKIPRT